MIEKPEGHIESCGCGACQIVKDLNRLKQDTIFINHIKGHLEKGEKVICKICGKTVDEIIAEFQAHKEG